MRTCKFSELKMGDWFEVEGQRFICGANRLALRGANKLALRMGWSSDGCITCFSHDDEVTPLPDCTDWDWQPEPETWYRGECLDPHMPCLWYQRYEDAAPMMADDYIGYTIRRVWPDGRVEQEFVPKGES